MYVSDEAGYLFGDKIPVLCLGNPCDFGDILLLLAVW